MTVMVYWIIVGLLAGFLAKVQFPTERDQNIFVPIGSASINIVSYNSQLVKPAEFKSYWELLEPKWKGRIVAMDPRAGGYGRSGARLSDR